MKKNKYFITLLDELHNFRKFVTVTELDARSAAVKAIDENGPEGYDMIEEIVRIA